MKTEREIFQEYCGTDLENLTKIFEFNHFNYELFGISYPEIAKKNFNKWYLWREPESGVYLQHEKYNELDKYVYGLNHLIINNYDTIRADVNFKLLIETYDLIINFLGSNIEFRTSISKKIQYFVNEHNLFMGV